MLRNMSNPKLIPYKYFRETFHIGPAEQSLAGRQGRLALYSWATAVTEFGNTKQQIFR
jgi:hypothetical protein